MIFSVISVIFVFQSIEISATSYTNGSIDDLPLYWGWFVNKADSTEVLTLSFQTLEYTLSQVPDFFYDVIQYTGQNGIDQIIDHYTREAPNDVLHCTAMYNGQYPNYTPGAHEYANQHDVKTSIGRSFTIHSIGWILTPRTFGARLKLTAEQLALWNQDDTEGNSRILSSRYVVKNATFGEERIGRNRSEKKIGRLEEISQDPDVYGNFHPTSGFGSRAHFTLGCAPGIGAVTTGLDLVDIIKLEQQYANETPNNYLIPTYEVYNGWLRNYGNGQWVFYPRTQYLTNTKFLPSDSSSHLLPISYSVCLLVFISLTFG